MKSIARAYYDESDAAVNGCERGDIFRNARAEFRQSFLDDLQTALAELPEGMEKSRLRGISQLSAVVGKESFSRSNPSVRLAKRCQAATDGLLEIAMVRRGPEGVTGKFTFTDGTQAE